jgi:uncharacterized protein YndB with AHSA1/START domain
MGNPKQITVKTTVEAPVSVVWAYWTEARHVKKWNHASPDWHTPKAENQLRPGGKFNYRMEAKDGSFGFDFWGTYDEVEPNHKLSFTLGDGRRVGIRFKEVDGKTHITETFEAEGTNALEMQKNGWQAILDNFKKYVKSETNRTM